MPKLAEHIKQQLPSYLLDKYSNPQPYNYSREDDPPPAYDADHDSLPSYYENNRVTRKFDWSKLTLIFSTVEDRQSNYTSMVVSKDALPGFGRATEIYAMFLGTDTKSTIFGNVESNQIFPAVIADRIVINVRNGTRDNRTNYALNQLDQSMMHQPTQ